MKFTQLMQSTKIRFVFVSLLSCLLAPTGFSQVPAQSPLLNKSGGGVPPNIVLTVDDSGSMTWRHMPETVFAGDTFSVVNPVGGNGVRMEPSDTYQYSVNARGTVSGNIASLNWVLRALRSPDTNTIYYNPENQYLPWANADGITRRADSPPSAAFIDPVNVAATINLTVTTPVMANAPGWCYAGGPTQTGAAAAGVGCANVPSGDVTAGALLVGFSYKIKTLGTTNFTLIGAPSNTVNTVFTANGVGSGNGVATSDGFVHDPGTYFRLQKTAGLFKDMTIARNYDALTINGSATSYAKHPKRTDCVSSPGVCTKAEEQKNYANWFSYYRTRNLMARGSMMEAFWTTANTFRIGWGLINSTNRVIDGVNTNVIQSGVRPFTSGSGSTKEALYTWLRALPASGGTPLPAALDAVGKYYMRTDTQGPYTDDPSVSSNVIANNKTCRRSYQILTTDGYWTSTPSTAGNNDSISGLKITGAGGKEYTYVASTPYSDSSANTLADYAMKYWKTDLQTGIDNKVAPVGDDPSFWQNMTNFTVGLGVRGQLNPVLDLPALTAGTKIWPAAGPTATTANIDDLWHAAVNSRGQYFSAKDPSELATAIKTALNLSAGGTGSTAGVATASTVLEDSNRKYVPSYIAGEWSGDIAARPLDANGQTKTAVWNAAAMWPVNPLGAGGSATDWNKRKIYTWDSELPTPKGVPFTWNSLSTGNQLALGSVAALYQASFVDYLRGDHTNEGTSKPFRSRLTGNGMPFVLGDFVNSNPVYVQKSVDLNYGRLPTGGSAYSAFLSAKALRQGVLFVGANDGMLHAFKDSKSVTAGNEDGQEVFAYVPRAVYPNLVSLTLKTYGSPSLPHQYFVDGWQRETDAYVKGSGSITSWRNFLVGSLGAGGKAIYALDVTDTVKADGTNLMGASTIRWEFSSADDSDMGYVMSPIEVGVLPNGKWVALVGNGLGSANGKAVLFVVDLDTGAVIQKLPLGSGGNNGLGGVATVKNSAGQITGVYAGDQNGFMWRLDFDTAADGLKIWEQAGVAKALMQATDPSSNSQPITQAPLIYKHSMGGSLVVFGTGRLFAATDAADLSTQSMYGVWDKDPDTSVPRTMTRSNLQSRTVAKLASTVGATAFYALSGTAVDWNTQRGWVVDLKLAGGDDIPGLRVIYPPQFVSNEIALISTVGPAQSAVVCENNAGKGIGFLLDVEQGANPKFNVFDTNGLGGVTSADQIAAGYSTDADGIDSIVYSPAKDGPNSTPDGTCAAGYYRVSIQNTTGQMMTCIKRAARPGMKDRVQRRIIVPPIR